MPYRLDLEVKLGCVAYCEYLLEALYNWMQHIVSYSFISVKIFAIVFDLYYRHIKKIQN